MLAAQISEYGSIENVVVNEVPQPTAGAGQVLVEVYASSINPFDSAIRKGQMESILPIELPFTLGGDIAGIVAEVGDGVTHVAVGDPVYGSANVATRGSGAFAQFARTSGSQVAKAPGVMDVGVVGALPLTGTSALQALTKHIRLAAGQKILIHGGAGGVGSIAIQIAKHLGAYVATTVAPGDIDYAHQLGADLVIDYTTQAFPTLVSGYDAVLDTVGGDVFTQSYAVLQPGGIAVSLIARVDQAAAAQHSITAITQSTSITTEVLDELAQMVNSGFISRVRIDSAYQLDKIQEAFAKRESGTAKGKVTLEF